jgi:hypothetical protein
MNTTELLQTLAHGLDATLKKVAPGVYFSLLIWQKDQANYVSNAERENVRKAMEELLERWGTHHRGRPDKRTERPPETVPYYLHLPSGAGVATIHLPVNATADDVQELGQFVWRDENHRLWVKSDRGDPQQPPPGSA